MFSNLIQWLRTHVNLVLAVIAGLALLASALVFSQWWGDRAWGTLVGVAVTILVFTTNARMFDVVSTSAEQGTTTSRGLFPWLLLTVALMTALIVRRFSGQGFRLPVQVAAPTLPSPQSLLLLLFGIVLVMLLWVFGKSLRDGDGVAIESHWGGLGGGIAGWRLSAPLIYLLGIVFLLGISATVAWRIFPPPKELAGASQVPSPSPSPSLSPTSLPPSSSPSPSVRTSPSASQSQ
jgi:hypothetical protein